MSAGIYKIWCEQGATFQLPITWRDSSGNPINLTGFTARMQIRPNKASSNVLATLTTENGGITLGGTNGLITLSIDKTATAAFNAGAYVYDLQLTNVNVVYRLIEGAFIVDGEVTK